MRLQKFIASTGLMSRRAAELAIEEGRVTVNGEKVQTHGIQVDIGKDVVCLDGKPITPASKKRIVLFHKPANVVSTMHDPQGRVSLDTILPEEYKGLFPVGRLDRETTGLLIFTNDGDLAERLLHPRYELQRIYIAIVEGKISQNTLNRAKDGLELDDGPVTAELSLLQATTTRSKLRVQIAIGRKRVVRRMLAALGHPVVALHRTEHGPFKLSDLAEGEFLELDHEHYGSVTER